MNYFCFLDTDFVLLEKKCHVSKKQVALKDTFFVINFKAQRKKKMSHLGGGQKNVTCLNGPLEVAP